MRNKINWDYLRNLLLVGCAITLVVLSGMNLLNDDNKQQNDKCVYTGAVPPNVWEYFNTIWHSTDHNALDVTCAYDTYPSETKIPDGSLEFIRYCYCQACLCRCLYNCQVL
jgi:hypothetical protein